MKIEQSPYRLLYIDLTKRCNMKCTNCYQHSGPDVKGTDITVEFLEDVCKRLPQKSEIRFCGGEPTLHEDLFEMLDIARKYNHLPSVVSNGLKYNDTEFMKEVVKRKTTNWCIALNGGFDPKLYKLMDGDEKYFDLKMNALDSLLINNVSRIYVNFILIKKVTLKEFPKILDICISRPIKGLKLRSLGYLGRNADGEMTKVKPLYGKEFKMYLHDKYIPENEIQLIRSGLEPDCNECCYRFYWKKLYMSFAEFASENSQKCWLRGKILNDYTVEPFFANMMKEDKK